MKTTPLDSFLKFYVMGSTQVDLYGIAHVKVDFIPLQKMYVIPRLGRFVWTTCLVRCGILTLGIRSAAFYVSGFLFYVIHYFSFISRSKSLLLQIGLRCGFFNQTGHWSHYQRWLFWTIWTQWWWWWYCSVWYNNIIIFFMDGFWSGYKSLSLWHPF